MRKKLISIVMYLLILVAAAIICLETFSVLKELFQVRAAEGCGGIILMYPKPETAKALFSLNDEIQKQGLRVVPLNQLGVD